MKLYGGLVRVAGGTLIAAVTAVTMMASPAFAKSDISLSVTPHVVKAGQRVHAIATGGDDSAGNEQLCLDIRSGRGSWHTARCISDYLGAGGPLSGTYRLPNAGTESFRAQLLVAQKRGYHVELTSATVVVRVR
ncbi:MAG: hypothetical protein ABSA93_40355 [Streptosporangiaceae bacterium]|jgi:hypothetical protein